jgi:superkiller protein 3
MSSQEYDERKIHIVRPDSQAIPEQAQSPEARAESLFQQGLSAAEGNNPDAALKLFKEAVDLNPDVPGYWVSMGTIYIHKGEVVSAEQCYRRAIETNPYYGLANYNLACMLDKLGNDDQALEYYQNALESDPPYVDAHYNMALLLIERKEYEEAMYHFQEFLKCNPKEADRKTVERQIQELKEDLKKGSKIVPITSAKRRELRQP